MTAVRPVVVCFWLFLGLLEAIEVPPKIHELLEDLLYDSTFDVQRDPVACSPDTQPRELTDYSGWFVSPDYPDNYPNNANCLWLIRSQEPGGVVELNFTFLAIESSYDSLVIYDGPTTAAPILVGFDGPWNPSLPTGIRSTSDSVLVGLYSDASVRGRGFNVSYTSDVMRTMTDPCYPLSRPLLVTDYSGSFQTNNYPSPYWSYSDCSWLVESQEPGGTLSLSFSYFASVGGDYLYLYDGPNAQAPIMAAISGFYGLNPNLRYTTTGSYLFARFVSDRTSVDRGFNAEYSSVPASSKDNRRQ